MQFISLSLLHQRDGNVPSSLTWLAVRVSVRVYYMVEHILPGKRKDLNEGKLSLFVNAEVFHFECKRMPVKYSPAIL